MSVSQVVPSTMVQTKDGTKYTVEVTFDEKMYKLDILKDDRVSVLSIETRNKNHILEEFEDVKFSLPYYETLDGWYEYR